MNACAFESPTGAYDKTIPLIWPLKSCPGRFLTLVFLDSPTSPNLMVGDSGSRGLLDTCTSWRSSIMPPDREG